MNQKKTIKRPNRTSKTSKAKRPGRAKREFTAGGVVWRRHDDGGIDILMIQDRLGRWTIPKGHVENGEKLEQTALREVTEETGLQELRLGERLGKNDFFYRREGKLIYMTTFVYLVEALGDTNAVVPEDSEGIADARWFPHEEAMKLIAYRATKILFRQGLTKLGVLPLSAGAIIK